MLNSVTGKVVAVLPMVSGTSAKGEWKKATIVIEYVDGNYTNHLALDNMKKADEFASLAVGTEIEVSYSVVSRENNGRWYTSANAVSWKVASQSAPASSKAPFLF